MARPGSCRQGAALANMLAHRLTRATGGKSGNGGFGKACGRRQWRARVGKHDQEDPWRRDPANGRSYPWGRQSISRRFESLAAWETVGATCRKPFAGKQLYIIGA